MIDGRWTVLAVDDDEAVLDLVRMVLEPEGYELVPARDGREALAHLASLRPALILLDMRMPGMNGWQFAAAYRASAAAPAPIVVMTAGRDAGETAAEIEADGSLAKPFDVADLVAVAKKYRRNGHSSAHGA
jgi:CheY-like chemotaxis protein